MVESARVVMADEVKLREILSERGLPAKLEVRLTPTERKIHEVLCATYNFAIGVAALEIPRPVLRQCGAQFQKVWEIHDSGKVVNGKLAITFSLTPEATRTTLRTALVKDVGIFKAKVNQVRLHVSWTKHMKAKSKSSTTAPVDWSKHEEAAKRHNAAVTEQILDGKTFNAQKDNPWARKNLKNWKSQQN